MTPALGDATLVMRILSVIGPISTPTAPSEAPGRAEVLRSRDDDTGGQAQLSELNVRVDMIRNGHGDETSETSEL